MDALVQHSAADFALLPNKKSQDWMTTLAFQAHADAEVAATDTQLRFLEHLDQYAVMVSERD